MNIYVNAPKSLIDKVKFSGTDFFQMSALPKSNAEGAAIVIEGDKAQRSMEVITEAGIPAVILAGTQENKGGEWYQKAMEHGFSESSIIYMNGGTLISHDDHKFQTPVPKGVTVAAMVELAKYAVEKKLIPEQLIFWNPSTAGEQVLYNPNQAKSQPTQATPPTKPESRPETKHDHKPTPAPNTGSPQHNAGNQQPRNTQQNQTPAPPLKPANPTPAPKIKTLDVVDLAQDCDCLIVAIRTIDDAKSGRVAKAIAGELGALHVELGLTPTSYTEYGDNLEKSIFTGLYAYADNNHVQVKDTYRGGSYLVVEANFSVELGDTIEKLLFAAKHVIQIPGDFMSSQNQIKQWLGFDGLKFDAIIPDDEANIGQYRNAFPDIVMDTKHFVNSLS